MATTAGDATTTANDASGTSTATAVTIDVTSIARVVVAGLVAAGAFAVARGAPAMVTKVAVGTVVALAFDPVTVRLQHRFGWSRGPAVLVIGLGLTVLFGAVLVVLGPAAIDEATTLRRDLPATIEETYSWPIVGDRLADADLATTVDEAIDALPTRLDTATITRFAEGALGGLFTAVVVLVTAVALLLDGPGLVDRLRVLIPKRSRTTAVAAARVVYDTFGSYFAGSLVIAVLNGLVLMTLALVLGIPLAPLIGLWAALTNLIPQIGGFLGGSFLVVLALTQGPVTAVIALAVFLVYQQFENNVVQPAIVGRAVDLSPPATMLAALIGGAVAGVGDQTVGQCVRATVGGTGAGDAQVREPGPAEVFDQGQRPGLQDLQGDGHGWTSRNCTHMPGTSSAGLSRSTSHSGAVVRPISCQPPGDSRG